MTKTKPFIRIITRKKQVFHQKKIIAKNLRKKMLQLLLMFCMLKKKKYIYIYILIISQNMTQILKTSYSFNDSKWGRTRS